MENNLATLDEISHFRGRNPAADLIIDTNVLLLLFIGAFSQKYLDECPLMKDNGKNYTAKHFELLMKVVNKFPRKVAFTPHILSEISMLSRTNIKPPERFKEYFASLLIQLEKCKEEYIEMAVLVRNSDLVEFGFGDVSLIEITQKNKWILLTDDLEMYRRWRKEIPIIYFSSIVAREIQGVS